MSQASSILEKLRYANEFVARFKARLGQASALPPLLIIREKELNKAAEQRAYWVQREQELIAEIADKKHTLVATTTWLDAHQEEYEQLEATASAKVNKLATELAELLKESEVESSAHVNEDPGIHQ